MHFDRLIARKRRNAARKTSPVVEAMEDRKLLTYVLASVPQVTEGTGANSTLNYTIKLLTASTSTVQVNYNTADGTAKAGEDYLPTSGTVTFAPGQTVQTVPVTIIGDAKAELSESFSLKLSNPVNAAIFTPSVGTTILDDDVVPPPALTFSDVAMIRGLTGSRTMTFTIKLNAAQKTAVSVTAATSNATAIAGVDYLAKRELITFAPGETTKSFDVTVFGSTVTTDKIFFVKLSGATVTLTKTTAAGTLKYGA